MSFSDLQNRFLCNLSPSISILTLSVRFKLCVYILTYRIYFLYQLSLFSFSFSFCVHHCHGGCHSLLFLGRVPYKSLDFANFFRLSKHEPKWFGSTRSCGSNIPNTTLSLWWGGTSYLVPTHRSPVHSCGHQIAKTQIRQCSPQPAQASPPGHLDTLVVCNDSDHPFNLLKAVLLGQCAWAHRCIATCDFSEK